MAEFPSLGQQCGVATCSQLDFLPVSCKHCRRSFCQAHSFADQHACTDLPSVQVEKAESCVRDPSLYCTAESCKNYNLVAIICESCERNFCIQHRNRESHSCPTLAALPLGVKTAPVPTPTGFIAKELPTGHKNKPMADRLKVMRLKQKAKGEEDKIAISERIYFAVVLVKDDSTKQPEVPIFVNKDWTVGRAVDSIGRLLSIKYETTKPGAKRLRLFATDEYDSSLPFDCLLSAVESLHDGATVFVKVV